jgi:hypothetical protein
MLEGLGRLTNSNGRLFEMSESCGYFKIGRSTKGKFNRPDFVNIIPWVGYFTSKENNMPKL